MGVWRTRASGILCTYCADGGMDRTSLDRQYLCSFAYSSVTLTVANYQRLARWVDSCVSKLVIDSWRSLGLAKNIEHKIVIGGYYGFGNIGDDAMLDVLIRLLSETLPKARVTVLSQNPRLTRHTHQVEAINRWNVLQIGQALERSALFVLGGGSLLQDSTSQKSLYYYLGLINWAKYRRKPVFLIGQGIGPLMRKSSRSRVASTLAVVDAILLRDRESYDELISLGLDEKRLICGEDLALLASPIGSFRRLSSHIPGGKYYCVVLKNGLTQTQIFNLAKNFDNIYGQLGLRTVLLPFFKERDWRTLQAIAKAMKTHVELMNTANLVSEKVLRVIAESQFVIGMRLHSLVFALNAHVPFAAINYDPKIERFVHRLQSSASLQLPIWEVEELNKTDMFDQINQLCADDECIRARLAMAQQKLSHEAQRAWSQMLSRMVRYFGEMS